jgi:tetratricopeptide (TPR) repeat protein
VRGDLDSITLKALEKERARRYGSPSDLAADIGRYLRNEAVLAIPPSAVYRARKFARRNRAALATLCAFVLLLMTAAGVSTWQTVVAKRQRDRADSEAAVAKAVNQFLAEDLLSQANPEAQDGVDASPDPEVKARTLLDRSAAKVEKRFGKQPLVESDIQHTIAKAYFGLGLNAEAERHMRKAYQLSAAHRGPDDPETLDLLMSLSGILIEQGKNSEAVSAAKAVFMAETRTLGPEHPRTVVAMQNLGSLYFSNNQYAEAEPLLIKALALQSRSLGYDNSDTLNTSDTLVALYISESKYAQARALLEKGLDSYRHLYGPEHPFTGREMFGLAKVLFGEGNYPQAEKLLEQLQALYVRVYGPRHPNLFYVQSILGQTYVEEGKSSQGISLLEKTGENLRSVVGVDPRERLKLEVALGWAYDAAGSLATAERIWRQALSGYRNLGKDDEVNAADVAELLGQNLSKQRRYEQAEPLLRHALAIREKRDPQDWGGFRARAFLGACLAGQRQYAQAEPLLLSGYEGMRQGASRMPAKQKKWIRSTGEQIVDLYSQWSKPAQATEWRAKLQDM